MWWNRLSLLTGSVLERYFVGLLEDPDLSLCTSLSVDQTFVTSTRVDRWLLLSNEKRSESDSKHSDGPVLSVDWQTTFRSTVAPLCISLALPTIVQDLALTRVLLTASTVIGSHEAEWHVRVFFFRCFSCHVLFNMFLQLVQRGFAHIIDDFRSRGLLLTPTAHVKHRVRVKSRRRPKSELASSDEKSVSTTTATATSDTDGARSTVCYLSTLGTVLIAFSTESCVHQCSHSRHSRRLPVAIGRQFSLVWRPDGVCPRGARCAQH